MSTDLPKGLFDRHLLTLGDNLTKNLSSFSSPKQLDELFLLADLIFRRPELDHEFLKGAPRSEVWNYVILLLGLDIATSPASVGWPAQYMAGLADDNETNEGLRRLFQRLLSNKEFCAGKYHQDESVHSRIALRILKYRYSGSRRCVL